MIYYNIWLSQFLPYKIKITTNYEISYFDFNIDRKSTLKLYLFAQPFLKILYLETSIISKSLYKKSSVQFIYLFILGYGYAPGPVQPQQPPRPELPPIPPSYTLHA